MNYEQYIHNENTTHIDKLNLISKRDGKIVVLYNLDDSNYKDVIFNILINKFGFNNTDKVYFDFGAKIINYNDIGFVDLSSRYGYNIRIFMVD